MAWHEKSYKIISLLQVTYITITIIMKGYLDYKSVFAIHFDNQSHQNNQGLKGLTHTS